MSGRKKREVSSRKRGKRDRSAEDTPEEQDLNNKKDKRDEDENQKKKKGAKVRKSRSKRGKRRVLMDQLESETEGVRDEQKSIQEAQESSKTTVEFQDDDQIIEMRVDASEFPSEMEEGSSEDEDDEQNNERNDQSFEIDDDLFEDAPLECRDDTVARQQLPDDNNATERRFIYVKNPEFDVQKEIKESKKQEEDEEERENRIVNKTVAKLQQFMTSNGYFRRSGDQRNKDDTQVVGG